MTASCEVCDAPLRSDNIYGVCDKTAECRREKWRRYRQRPGRQCRYASEKCSGSAEPGRKECAAHIAAAEKRRERRAEREELASQRRSKVNPCAACGQPTRSPYGVCRRTTECKHEADRRYRDANREAVRSGNRDRARRRRAARSSPPPKVRRQLTAEAIAKRAADRRAADRRWRVANREAIRRKDRKFLQRPDRPCRYAAAGCGEYAVVGQRTCENHRKGDYMRSRRRMRARLARRQEGLCPWCSHPLPDGLVATHIDHVIPKSSGFVIEDEWNLQVLHARCNQEKGASITPQAVALALAHGVALQISGASEVRAG